MHLRNARSLALAVTLAALSLAGASCKRPRTEVVLDIDTNIPMGALPDFKVQCAYNWDGEDERDVPGCSAEYTRGPGGMVSARVCLPGSIAFLVDPARDTQPFTVAVSGANNRYRNILQVTPVAEQFRLLRVRVHSACLAVSADTEAHPCPPLAGASCTLSESCIFRDMTCGNQGTCVSRTVPEGNLEAIPRTGPPDASLTESVNGQCPLSSFGDTDSGVPADSGSNSAPDASASSDASING